MPITLNDHQVIALKRKRGELNLSTAALGRQLKLSRRTVDNILKRNHRKVTPNTYKKLSDWLINEYATADIKDSTTVATQDK
ncbi:helix-turn-helix transcriptional regulator [Limosilactobacillus reuteri]|uniref:helix-turn-helix domain-containing protein n=1 Tax=Limosilactobacillus reuteri TaxID=1598 RepID=UPI001E2A7D60|nr:helix-turn-helix transcriptional regulator [Limosilactobacillus reuteri]MCC4383340.1 helix-turn-helix transcriptional regulator [Limosilactobacillus reuteri]MCC4420177.1 helix-turn-helix transcriptional regulator [Limosilactobacillus reuteri]